MTLPVAVDGRPADTTETRASNDITRITPNEVFLIAIILLHISSYPRLKSILYIVYDK